ncbi:MAG: hypothetical protein FWG83_02775 [Oscillospiraceae bacterium]|nr:hypothetical protein [Oscillospiraceae bacterium]
MGLLDKAKGLADKAKQSIDDKVARADSANEEKENEGLSPEEIAAKDAAKAIILFNKFELGASFYEKGEWKWKEKGSFGFGLSDGKGSHSDPLFGLRVKFTNTSDRRAKYVVLGVSVINSVGDVIQTKDFEITGPFESGKKSESTFRKCLDKQAEKIKLSKVAITYFDGDTVTLEGKWLNRLIKDGAGASLMNFVKA